LPRLTSPVQIRFPAPFFLATSPSGKAEACKAFITGSNPVVASIKTKKGLSGSDSPFF
jgi:hypothetical protein